MAVRALRNGSVSSRSGDGKARGAMLIRAPAQRIAAAAVVASACGTTGGIVAIGGCSSSGRAPEDDLMSAKELRSRCGIDDTMFTVEVRREVDGAHVNEEYPGGECIGDDNDDAVEGGLVV